MTIRARFVVAVVCTIALVLALFAAFSLTSVAGRLRTSLDLQVRTTAQAVAAAIDVTNGRLAPDRGDREQIAKLRASTNATVVDVRGRTIDGDVPPVRAFSQSGATFGVEAHGDTQRVAIEPVVRHGRTYGYIVAWRSDDYIEQFLRTGITVAFLAGAAALLLGALIALRVAHTVVAPLETIAGLAERIETRDLSLRVAHHGRDELGRLAAAFDRMLDRLEAAFSRERTFTADASHELRAPLSVLRAEAELALRRERTGEEYRRALEGIMRETGRLEDLVDDLLAAARAEVDGRHRIETDVGEIARSVVERSLPAAQAKAIEVRATIASGEIACLDAAGFERALLAVVHNAISFAPPGGCVDVQVRGQGDLVDVSVRDNGPGFSPQALKHAAERFWRGDGARSRGGTGLGLAIAGAIVSANDGTLHWGNTETGAEVRISFPTTRS